MDIREIKDRLAFEGFLLVRSASMRKSQNGRCFVDLLLADRSGTIGAKIWDWNAGETPPEPGQMVKVAGSGNTFNGKVQLRVDRWRVAGPEDGVSLADFVPSAPDDPRMMLKTVLETAAGLRDDAIRKIVNELLREATTNDQLLTAPAAKQLHHAELGGLLHHMTGMLRMAQAVLGIYDHLNPDLLLAGIIVHDLGKLRELLIDETGLAADYSVEGKLLGHLVRGAMDIERVAEKVGAPREPALLLEHMVLAHHGKLEFGSPVLPKIPEAEVLSLLDVLDARIFEMRDALEGVETGGFSAKVWALDNRELYNVPVAGGPAAGTPAQAGTNADF